MSASHCPSKETAESENCSNTESRNSNLHVKKKTYKKKKKEEEDQLHIINAQKNMQLTQGGCALLTCVFGS